MLPVGKHRKGHTHTHNYSTHSKCIQSWTFESHSIFLPVSSLFSSLLIITGFLPLGAAFFMFTAKLCESEVYKSSSSWDSADKTVKSPWHRGGRSVTVRPKLEEEIFFWIKVQCCCSRELNLCQPLKWSLSFNTSFVNSVKLKPGQAYEEDPAAVDLMDPESVHAAQRVCSMSWLLLKSLNVVICWLGIQ